MRTSTDQHWWTMTAPTTGDYIVRLSELPRTYGLEAYSPSGSSSSTGNTLSDRVVTRTLRAGERLDIRVAVSAGSFSTSQPYRLRIIVQEDDEGRMTAYDLNYPNGGN